MEGNSISMMEIGSPIHSLCHSPETSATSSYQGNLIKFCAYPKKKKIKKIKNLGCFAFGCDQVIVMNSDGSQKQTLIESRNSPIWRIKFSFFSFFFFRFFFFLHNLLFFFFFFFFFLA